MYQEGFVYAGPSPVHYTATHPEPTYLQLLWWEFPVSTGMIYVMAAWMNFSRAPPSIAPNTGYGYRPKLQIAGQFAG
jgi:hypothetical protein